MKIGKYRYDKKLIFSLDITYAAYTALGCYALDKMLLNIVTRLPLLRIYWQQLGIHIAGEVSAQKKQRQLLFIMRYQRRNYRM